MLPAYMGSSLEEDKQTDDDGGNGCQNKRQQKNNFKDCDFTHMYTP